MRLIVLSRMSCCSPIVNIVRIVVEKPNARQSLTITFVSNMRADGMYGHVSRYVHRKAHRQALSHGSPFPQPSFFRRNGQLTPTEPISWEKRGLCFCSCTHPGRDLKIGEASTHTQAYTDACTHSAPYSHTTLIWTHHFHFYGLYSYGLYSYGLYGHGLYSYDAPRLIVLMACIVMAYIVMAHLDSSFSWPV